MDFNDFFCYYLKEVNGKQIVNLLEKNDWTLKNVVGSHHHFEKLDFPLITVPVHGKQELPYGTERKILKDSDLLRYWKNKKGGQK